jgi:hypothetical protein
VKNRFDLKKTIAFLALSAPALGLLFLIHKFAINVICVDDWPDSVLLVHQAITGTLSRHDLFAQFFEHRILVPRVATLILWKLGGGLRNLPAMEMDWFLLCGIALALFFSFRLSPKNEEPPLPLWYFLPVALWLFSPYNLDLFQGGTGGSYTSFQWMYTLMGAISAFVFLDRSEGVDGWFWSAVAMGYMATFSNAQGLMVWPAGLAAKIISDKKLRGQTRLWLLIGASAWGAYFWSWNPSATVANVDGGGLGYAFFHPLRAAECFISYWGIPFSFEIFPFGIFVLLFSVYIFRESGRKKVLRHSPLWRYLWLYAFFAAAEVSIGRAWEGVGNRESCFYLTPTLAFIGLYDLSLAVYKERLLHRRLIATVFILASFSPLRGTLVNWKTRRFYYQTIRYAMRTYSLQSDAGLKTAWLGAAIVRELTPMLEKNHYNVFSEPAPGTPAGLKRSLGVPTICGLDAIDKKVPSVLRPIMIRAGEGVQIKGWAVDNRAMGPALGVYLSIDDAFYFPASYGDRRRDISRKLKMPQATYSGWEASFSPERMGLKPGLHTLSLKTLAADGSGYYLNKNLAVISLLGPSSATNN